MSSAPLVALVALNESQMPAESRLLDALRSLRPEYDVGPAEHKEGALVFRINGDLAAVSLVAQPIPWSQLGLSCAGAWYWPQATESLYNHVAHVLVAVQPAAADRVQAAMGVTALAAAVAETTPAAGVYWSANGLVHAPDAFVTYARQMTRDALPLLLWIQILLREEADGAHSVYTTGLRAFHQMELEVRGSRREPEFLMNRVFDVIHYLLEQNPVLHDGETIGTTNEERFSITLGPSTLDPNTEVVHLGL